MNLPWAFIFLPLSSAAAVYWTLFLILILSGVGLPVPEEITLLLGGYLAYLGFIDFWPAVYILFGGILAADALGYFMGRTYGERVFRKFERLPYASLVLNKGRYYFDKYGEGVVFFSRVLLGVRVAVPILAGHFRMNFTKFLFFDILASVPWTLFLVTLSYYLGSGLELIAEVREIKHIMFGIILALVTILAVQAIRKYPTH